ncbi:M48 family metallopeptidase [Acidovorax sp. HDW3]|uniref:M48 family metallopeptidase n=1 Tax=Acidovorax sp. HDW3 TaxID=2714923 RepID=UPI001408D15B|nr:SprT family zinc-dependent metalloprotease [Acidovorax sp. HDW3]QIL42990.1 M48 family metallopeptidase [Acidovorax sp. HDW3]
MASWVQQVLAWLDAPAPPPAAGVGPRPQARREVLLAGQRVPYRLQRARRKSIGMTVGADGLAVRAPSGVTLATIDAALQEKADWIVRKLGEVQQRQRLQEAARIVWQAGAQLPYLGAPLTLRLDATQRRRQQLLHSDADGGAQLFLGLAQDAQPAQIRDATQAWFLRQARSHFDARLAHFAPQLGVQHSRLRLSGAATRWGSARSDGSIMLNWRLLHYRPALIDYVVVHELSHLRVMDHSPQFWRIVATLVPDYAQLRQQLRAQPAPPWD